MKTVLSFCLLLAVVPWARAEVRWEGTLAKSWRLEQAGTLQFAKTE